MLFNVKTDLPDGDEFNSIDRFNEWKAAAIAELPSDAKPQKGDMLRDRDYNYRNDGKLIFDGVDWVDLCFKLDEYGALPSWVCYPEFPLGSHIFDIAHNNISWVELNENTRRQLANLYIEAAEEYSDSWQICGTLAGQTIEWLLDYDELEDALRFLQKIHKGAEDPECSHVAVDFPETIESIVAFWNSKENKPHAIYSPFDEEEIFEPAELYTIEVQND